MNTLVLILGLLFAIALISIIIILFTRRSLQAALAALVGILGGMVAGITAPSAEGAARVAFDFGSFGYIYADYLKMNPPNPTSLWLPAFFMVGALIFAAMFFIYEQSIHRGN